MSMWYRMPAERWAQSIPLGNGRIGAMVWGGITSDTLSLSEVTDWSGEDHRSKNLDNDGSTDNWAALNNLREEMKKDTPDRSKVTQYLSKWEARGTVTLAQTDRSVSWNLALTVWIMLFLVTDVRLTLKMRFPLSNLHRVVRSILVKRL